MGISLSAQAPASTSDAGQITSLMASLSDHSKNPADVLDPNLSASDRQKNLKHFNAPHYELNLTPVGDISEITSDTASVPVSVHFKTDDGNSLDANATAQFVRRNGTWYFSNFDFMAWPVFLIVVLIVGMAVGISYAITVVILRSRLAKQGQQWGVNIVKIFIPIFWPALFRQTRRT
jgi:hypothetical protein